MTNPEFDLEVESVESVDDSVEYHHNQAYHSPQQETGEEDIRSDKNQHPLSVVVREWYEKAAILSTSMALNVSFILRADE